MKVGIVGARVYTNEMHVRDFIFALRQRFPEDLQIVSGEQKRGADGYAKRHALKQGVRYVSFPPYHYSWNIYCYYDSSRYNKPYSVSNFFSRNQDIVDYSDIIFAFIPEGTNITDHDGTFDTYKKAIKANKPIYVIC